MKIKIWGARGSLPSPLYPDALKTHIHELFHDFFDRGHKHKTDIDKYFQELPQHKLGGYGGNTPCVEVSTQDQQIIIDGGSGIRTLGYELMNGPCGRGQGEVHIFFTHFHFRS